MKSTRELLPDCRGAATRREEGEQQEEPREETEDPAIETIVYLHRKLNDTTAREETEHPAMQSVVYKDRKLI